MKQKIRFENHGQGPSFVELFRDTATSYQMTYGRFDTPLTRRVEFESELATQAALEKHLFRLGRRRGFLIGRHEPTLVSLIQSDLHNETSFAVYSDWLLEKSDPRGHLISAMLLQKSQDVNVLLNLHPEQLLPQRWEQFGVSVTWRFGFADEVVIHGCQYPHIVSEILRHPTCSMLRLLTIHNAVALDWRGLLNTPVYALYVRGIKRRSTTLKRIVMTNAKAAEAQLKSIEGIEIS